MKILFYFLSLGCLLIGIYFFLSGMNLELSAVQQCSFFGASCFCGIISRILQSEAHKSE
jgi:hypothetical protein